jgi:hypothetical protein
METDMTEDQQPSDLSPSIFAAALTPSQIARRGFVLASMGFLAACASQGSSKGVAGSMTRTAGQSDGGLPPGMWTSEGKLPAQRWAQPASPQFGTEGSARLPSSVDAAIAPKKAVVKATDKPDAVATSTAGIPKTYDGRVIARSAWCKSCPDPKEMDPLGKVRKITIHHTGNPYKFTDTGVAEVKEELAHVMRGEMGEGHLDIAYHYVIDPAGRVWAARDIRYEGRHTRDWKGVENRSGNIGVMLLGNFELQNPSAAQLAALTKFVDKLQKQYKIPSQKLVGGRRSKEVGVFTHQQLSPTECPGDYLQGPWERKIFPRLVKSV